MKMFQRYLEDCVFFHEEFCNAYCSGCPKKRIMYGEQTCPTDFDFFSEQCCRYGGTEDIEEAIKALVNAIEAACE